MQLHVTIFFFNYSMFLALVTFLSCEKTTLWASHPNVKNSYNFSLIYKREKKKYLFTDIVDDKEFSSNFCSTTKWQLVHLLKCLIVERKGKRLHHMRKL